MYTIVSIERQPRQKNQFTLTLDDGSSLSLHREVIAKHRISTGMTVDDEQLKAWIREGNSKSAVESAMYYLTWRTRTRKQLLDYLSRKGFEAEAAEEAVRKMEEYGFLNDEKYALDWVQSRKTGKPAGRRKIAYELRSKGISQDILDQALDNLTAEDEFRQAMKLAEKAFERHRSLPLRERMAKTSQTLQRRGFEWELISRVLRKLADSEDASEDHLLPD
ncbi:MAG: regulatory protein RecX [Caldicoprobacterales bacterium]|jgi:regulatory protein|nr:hypothetical protein [Clostridiales bacterium]